VSLAGKNPRKKLLSDGLASTLIALLVKLRGLILLPIISRASGIADYGLWVQVTVLIGLVPPLFGFNIHQSVTRFAAGQDASRAFAMYRRLLGFVFRVSTLGGLVACAASYFFLANDSVSRAIACLCTILIPAISINKLSVAYVRGRGDVKLAYSLDAALNVASFVASAVAFGAGWGVVGGVASLVAVYSVFSLTLAYQHFRRQPAASLPDATPLSDYISYSLPTIPAAMADWVLFGVDRYVIAYFVDNTAVGVYAASYSLATTLLLFSVPVEYALMPLISELWERGDKPGAMRLTKDALAYVGVPSLLGAVLLVKDGPWLLHALSAADVAGDARRLLLCLAPGLFLWTLTRVLFQVYFGKKRTSEMAATLLVAAVLNVICNLILVPRLGSVGAAIATALAYVCTLSITLVRLRSDLALAPSSTRPWGLALAVAAPCATALLLPEARSFGGVLLHGVLCSSALAATLAATGSLQLRKLLAERRQAAAARAVSAKSEARPG
jgi:O-antigen/teichoic acid export membrane protein